MRPRASVFPLVAGIHAAIAAQPQNLTATGQDATVALSWTAPASTGGSLSNDV